MDDDHRDAAAPAKRILVPTDFSECSKRALEYARFLSKPEGASITLLHVVERPRYMSEGTEYASFEEYASRHFEAALKDFFERDPAISEPVTVEMEFGNPHDSIVRRAQDFDLVAMGTHGRSGFQHFVIGSVTARVARRVPCPVVTVREDIGVHLNQLNRILVPVDPACRASRTALTAALEWGARYGADVEVLHAWEPPPTLAIELGQWTGASPKPADFSEQAAHRAAAALDEFVSSVGGPDPVKRLERGRPDKVIVDRARAGDFDLVVIGSHGSAGVARWIFGSVAEKVLRACHVPVLTMHAE